MAQTSSFKKGGKGIDKREREGGKNKGRMVGIFTQIKRKEEIKDEKEQNY